MAANASIPYNTLAKTFDDLALLKGKDKLIPNLKVRLSTNGTSLSLLKLEVNSSRGAIPIKLGADGQILEFPLTRELRSENPPVTSNQPEGAISIRMGVSIRYPGLLDESATYYAGALDDLNAAIKKKLGLLALAVPKLKTVVFEFEPSKPATVTVCNRKENRTVEADEKGRIKVEFSSIKAGETRIILPREPKNITVSK